MDNYIFVQVVVFFVVAGQLEEVHSFGTAYQENGEHLMKEKTIFSNDVSEFPSQNWAESTSRQRITPKGSRGRRLKQRTKSRSALLGYVPLPIADNQQEELLQQLKVKRSTDGVLKANKIVTAFLSTDILDAQTIIADTIKGDTVISKTIDVRSKKNRPFERMSFVGAQGSHMTRTQKKHSRRPSHKASDLNGNIGIDYYKNPSGNNDRQSLYRTFDDNPSRNTFKNPSRSKKGYRATEPPLDFVEQNEITKQSINELLEANTISTVHMSSVNLAPNESKSVSGKQTNTFIKPKSPTYEKANPILNVRPEKTTMQASKLNENSYKKNLGRQRLNIDGHPKAPESLISLQMLGITNTGLFAPKLKMFIEPTDTKEKIRNWDKKKNINSNSANLRRSNPTEYVGDNYKSFHKYSNVFNDSFMF